MYNVLYRDRSQLTNTDATGLTFVTAVNPNYLQINNTFNENNETYNMKYHDSPNTEL